MGSFCMVETLPPKASPQEAASNRYNILPSAPAAADSAGSTDENQARLLMPTSTTGGQLFRQSTDLGLEQRCNSGEGWNRHSRSGSLERKTSFGGTSPRPTFSPQFHQQLQQQLLQQRDVEGTQLVGTPSCSIHVQVSSF